MDLKLYKLILQDPVKCPGCNDETSELHVFAEDEEEAEDYIEQGLCATCTINKKIFGEILVDDIPDSFKI